MVAHLLRTLFTATTKQGANVTTVVRTYLPGRVPKVPFLKPLNALCCPTTSLSRRRWSVITRGTLCPLPGAHACVSVCVCPGRLHTFTVKFLTQRTGRQTQVDAPPETATLHQWRATRGPHTQRAQARRPLRPPPRRCGLPTARHTHRVPMSRAETVLRTADFI